ncbi:MAG: hypothetical protein K6G70_10985 [Bacteroidaceae bacterium]|nr:hypothetical protein [Bacteroidaceae bacterium]
MKTKEFITRPKTKPQETLKGKLNKWDNGYAEFIPTGTRESNRKMLKQLGGSSFYKNEGEKESSWSLHLNVDAKDCEDPVAALHDQFLYLTEGEQKQKPQMPEGSEGRMLLDAQNVKVWLDAETQKITILAQLDCTPSIERQLLQAQSTMNVCIGRHRNEIINHSN